MRPYELSAALLDAYRRRALSPVEVIRDVLERVAAFEPHIHALYLLAPERALAEARASEARWTRGEPIGSLDGVPRPSRTTSHKRRTEAAGNRGERSRPEP